MVVLSNIVLEKSSVTHLITIFRNGKRKESIFECFENGKVEERKRGEKERGR